MTEQNIQLVRGGSRKHKETTLFFLNLDAVFENSTLEKFTNIKQIEGH